LGQPPTASQFIYDVLNVLRGPVSTDGSIDWVELRKFLPTPSPTLNQAAGHLDHGTQAAIIRPATDGTVTEQDNNGSVQHKGSEAVSVVMEDSRETVINMPGIGHGREGSIDDSDIEVVEVNVEPAMEPTAQYDGTYDDVVCWRSSFRWHVDTST